MKIFYEPGDKVGVRWNHSEHGGRQGVINRILQRAGRPEEYFLTIEGLGFITKCFYRWDIHPVIEEGKDY